MRTLLKIIAVIVALLVLAGIGLNLYFTDERLKQTLMPYLEKTADRPVQVESMSLTFFRTFPRPGLNIKNLTIPGEQEGDTLLSLGELVTAVELWPLLDNRVNIAEISLNRPRFTYLVHADGTTNIDFLPGDDEAEEDTTGRYAVEIPYFEVSNGELGYRDATSGTEIKLSGLNGDISLAYDELISSSVDLRIGGLTVLADTVAWAEELPVSLTQTSVIDPAEETVKLEEGSFTIRGLVLSLSGSISGWSSTPQVDLAYSSDSDNFADLLRLVPEEYESRIEGLETGGSLSLNGSVKGAIGGEELPDFALSLEVEDGFIKDPDLPDPVEDIQLRIKAGNELVTVETFRANAGENSLVASGQLRNPLEENGAFTLNLNGALNLSTVSRFYDIGELDLEQLGGLLKVDAEASGNRREPENASFDGVLSLTNGSAKYAGVPEAVDNISIDARASRDLISINSLSLEAAQNRFSLKGNIHRPLDENNRSVDLNTDLQFNLATLKDFYPIDEDTLRMSGTLTARAVLKGSAEQIGHSVQSGSINLKNGMISYEKLGKPFRDITLETTLEGNRLNITKAGFRAGENNLNVSGSVTDYLSDDRTVSLHLQGDAKLDEIANYYDLRPAIEKLTGDARLNLTVRGPAGTPQNMVFDGNMTVKEVSMEGDSLVQPVRDLNGELRLKPQKATLESLQFQLGESDIALGGSLEHYTEYLKNRPERETTPHLTGSYSGKFLNLDELIEWDEESEEEPVPVELPDMTASLQAEISEMLITGITMNNLKARATTTPEQIKLEKATIELFEGEASGSFTWDLPRPDRTAISFEGSLDSLQAESFFEEYRILGQKSRFHEYVSGAFNAEVEYYSELDAYLDPQIGTTKMSGSFGMSRARLKGHPLQVRLADFLKIKELQNMALDEWKSTFTVENGILDFKDLRLTSGDIGMELSGTRHLVKETIDYRVKLYLPERFKGAIASVITTQATDALTQENGTIMIPLRVTGTHENPSVSPDQKVIAPIVKEYLKNRAGDVLKRLFGGDDNNDNNK